MQVLSWSMPIMLFVAIVFQVLLSIAILIDFLWVWQDPSLNPDQWAHFSQFPLWSIPSIADLFLGVLVMLVCSLGMVRHRAWAAPTYTIWLILSVLFNAFKPHYFINLFWFPSLWPLIFIGFFYVAQARWSAARTASRRATGDAGDRLAGLASRHRLLATAGVMLVTLLATALFMLLLSLLSLAVPNGLTGLKLVVGVASLYAFAGFTVRSLSARLLFDRIDRADLQIIGGFLLGSSWDIFRVRRATWPFAKLSVSKEAIRLQTPFGVYAWDKTDLSLTRKGFGRLGIGGADGTLPITFVFVPWQDKAIARRLAELGYV